MSEAAVLTNIPNHLGIILDGNRRWASAHDKKSVEGHRVGSDVFKDISLSLFDRRINYVSAYVFSTENWRRTAEEVDYMMKLVIKAVESHLSEYNKRNIKIRILGSRDNLKSSVIKAIDRTEEKTAGNTAGTLALCFNYGGRQEIVEATKKLVEKNGDPEDITEEMISSMLYAPEIPDLDLVVRTSGEKRTSGFMMWRAWYAEMSFIDKYWPDVTIEDFDKVLEDYNNRKRRFGK